MRIPNHLPFNVAKFPIFYGWIILVIGTIGVLFSIPGQTMGMSPFTNYLIEELGLSRDLLSNAYLIGTASSSFLLTKAGRLWDKNGARVVLIFSSLLLASSLVLGSYSPSIVDFISANTGLKHTVIAFTFITIFFFLIRFSGQGVLTLVSRNVIMKWFDVRRGLANGISSSFISLGFSLAPALLLAFITKFTWQGAWQVIAIALVGYCVLAVLFIRDTPEASGLLPDGKLFKLKGKRTSKFVTVKQFNLKEAKKTWTLWVYSLTVAFYSMYVTGFTFHIEAIFESVGSTAEKAFALFLPAAIVSIFVSVTLNILSDYIRLQYLLFVMLVGGILGTAGLPLLPTELGYNMVIAGNGIMSGVFTVLIAVAWPRFYGKKHLGEIAGFSASIMVISSSIGPVLFAYSLKLTGSFDTAAYISMIYLVFMFFAAFKAGNPQKDLV